MLEGAAVDKKQDEVKEEAEVIVSGVQAERIN